MRHFTLLLGLCLFTLNSFAQSFKTEVFNKNNLSSNLSYKGKIVDGAAWSDNNGMNYIILTESEISTKKINPHEAELSKRIYAYHYAVSNGNTKLLREVKDYTLACEFDGFAAEFFPGAIHLSDVDTDGYAEVGFAYQLDCSNDWGPNSAKVMLLENGDKYPIRGVTTIKFGEPGEEELLGGEYKLGKEFNDAPAGFKEQAMKIWNKHTK